MYYKHIYKKPFQLKYKRASQYIYEYSFFSQYSFHYLKYLIYISFQWFLNLRFRTQIMIIQTFFIIVIIFLVSMLLYFVIDKFYSFVKDELLEQVIDKSIVSSIQLSLSERFVLGMIALQQQQIQLNSISNLYKFYQKNTIQIQSSIEDCLQNKQSKQFYSYQFCYGVYGAPINKQGEQLKKFIALQNLITPFQIDNVNLEYYNILLDESVFVASYIGQYQPIIDENLLEAYYLITMYNLTGTIKQIALGNQKRLQIFQVIPTTKIAYGVVIDQYQQAYYKQEDEFYMRTQSLLLDGMLLTDTVNWNCTGHYFQNVSGFTNEQYQMILNFTIGLNVTNQCQKKLQGKILCLFDNNNQAKLIFTGIFSNSYLIIIVADGSFIQEIRESFDKELLQFLNQQVKVIFLSLLGLFAICLIFQTIILLKISHPLKALEEAAKYHINNQQLKILRLIRIRQSQEQIQQLLDSFYDTIDLSDQQNKRQKETKIHNDNFYQRFGLYQKHQNRGIIKQIKYVIYKNV
ncbi:hypothetical protein pb186bvf_005002 [Paramecium bursaria]